MAGAPGSSSALVCHADTVMEGVLRSWEDGRNTDTVVRGDGGAEVR